MLTIVVVVITFAVGLWVAAAKLWLSESAKRGAMNERPTAQ
jgi:hypothetical protein